MYYIKLVIKKAFFAAWPQKFSLFLSLKLFLDGKFLGNALNTLIIIINGFIQDSGIFKKT